MNEILGPIYYTFATDHDEDCRGKNLCTTDQDEDCRGKNLCTTDQDEDYRGKNLCTTDLLKTSFILLGDLSQTVIKINGAFCKYRLLLEVLN